MQPKKGIQTEIGHHPRQFSIFERTTKTEADYLTRCIQILERFAREYPGLDWDLHPNLLVKWLESHRTTVSKDSWRSIRASLAWFMDTVEGNPDLAARIREIETDLCVKATRTSAKKAKHVTPGEFGAIVSALYTGTQTDLSRGLKKEESVSYRTLLFFWSAVLTGLRPSEWESHKLYTPATDGVDELILVVENGKATNGRSHGNERTLYLGSLSGQEQDVVEQHSRFVKQLLQPPTSSSDGPSPFDKFQRQCGDKLGSLTKKLWPRKKRRPSLYTGRHQFSANLKSSDATLPEIGALMGHGTDRTATEHYGKARYGSGSRGVRADPDEIARVKRVFNNGASVKKAITPANR